jgi:hypothetical protein
MRVEPAINRQRNQSFTNHEGFELMPAITQSPTVPLETALMEHPEPKVTWFYEVPKTIRYRLDYYCFMHQIPRRNLIREIMAAELNGLELKPLPLPGGFPAPIGVWNSQRDNLQIPAQRENELLIRLAVERLSRQKFISKLIVKFLDRVEEY